MLHRTLTSCEACEYFRELRKVMVVGLRLIERRPPFVRGAAQSTLTAQIHLLNLAHNLSRRSLATILECTG